jgi:hypothetical protein
MQFESVVESAIAAVCLTPIMSASLGVPLSPLLVSLCLGMPAGYLLAGVVQREVRGRNG